jgi:hypothetical protein
MMIDDDVCIFNIYGFQEINRINVMASKGWVVERLTG